MEVTNTEEKITDFRSIEVPTQPKKKDITSIERSGKLIRHGRKDQISHKGLMLTIELTLGNKMAK